MTTFQERYLEAFADEKARRIEAGEARLTQTEIWKHCGVSSSSTSHWKSGRNYADLDTCMKIGEILRVNPHWLFDESMPKKSVYVAANNEPPSALDRNQQIRATISNRAVRIGWLCDDLSDKKLFEILRILNKEGFELYAKNREKLNTLAELYNSLSP